MTVNALLIEMLRSGTIASLAIMPLGPLFRSMGLRIGHYGPKFAALFIDNPATWQLVAQHFVIGWLATLPFLITLKYIAGTPMRLLAGVLYGAVFYVLINSLALPLYFGDPTPWQLGWPTIYPSLIGHIAFGLAIAVVSRRFAFSVSSP